MKKRVADSYDDFISRVYNRYNEPMEHSTRTVTLQVTDSCNLRCKYCYQLNKAQHFLSVEDGKKFLTALLDGDYDKYAGYDKTTAIIIEFIGGEPLLAIDIIAELSDFFVQELIRRDHKWLKNYVFSICSNGVLYFDPRVQAYIQKHLGHLSFSISIDGNKELHDSCRVFPDGTGSYDKAIAAVRHYRDYYHRDIGSKMTIAPGNIIYVADAVKDLIKNGYTAINLNCVYEEGWTDEHATILYNQLKEIADYLLENNLQDKIYLSMFEENMFHPKAKDDDDNWCWGARTPILTTRGYKDIEDVRVGDLVYTEGGTIQPVIDVKSHFADNCVEIKASGAFPLVATDNHKLYALKKIYDKYPIKSLRQGDLVRLNMLPKDRAVAVKDELAYLIGHYLASGNSNKENAFIINCRARKVKELIEVLERLGINFDYSKKGNKATLTLLTETVDTKYWFNKCAWRRVPCEILQWNDKALKSFINGFAHGCGTLKYNKQMIYSIPNYDLTIDILLILRTIGYKPVCKKTKDGYEIWHFVVGIANKYLKRFNDSIWTNNLTWQKVEPQTVYNLTVANDHSYFAGSYVSSNCGGDGSMLAVDWRGDLYPCIRYMESSLNGEQEPMIIGNVNTGIMSNEVECERANCLHCLKRSNQSTDECMNCRVAEGCGWCSGYHYQHFGTVYKRATYICPMHQARSLANVYYWNKVYRLAGENKRFVMFLEKEKALQIISENEWKLLKWLESPNEI